MPRKGVMSQPAHWLITARPILHYYRRALPVIAVLYVLSSFLEGIGLTLFIPLLQGISDPGRYPNELMMVSVRAGRFSAKDVWYPDTVLKPVDG